MDSPIELHSTHLTEPKYKVNLFRHPDIKRFADLEVDI